ncbi:MAG: competence type IV pilus major pilin ComGC [Aerococcus urinaeequi]
MKKVLVKFIQKCRRKKGFTLIEMVLVLFIVAALLLLIIPNMSKQTKNVETKTNAALVETVETQMELYLLEHDEEASVTAEVLAEQGYITDEQLEKYNAIPAGTVTP